MEGYEYTPKNTGIYVKLQKAGDRAKFRIVSNVYHFIDVFDGKEVERHGWIVIDKTDKNAPAARVFKTSNMVYQAIKDLVMDEEWGDPRKYDITVVRTEEKGKYYTVLASPNKSDLTAQELEMVKEAKLDPKRLFASKQAELHDPTPSVQFDDISDLAPEEEEINLEDVPF